MPAGRRRCSLVTLWPFGCTLAALPHENAAMIVLLLLIAAAVLAVVAIVPTVPHRVTLLAVAALLLALAHLVARGGLA